ncbi:MAG: SWIM zinc finger family protein [Oscillospiraceae bacterium]|nr:SWIM zinc finger family protein [Oscillospiraceae bacterium]
MSLNAAIQHADENFLIALSNKGLLARALRELPSAGVSVSWEGDRLIVAFADETSLTIEGTVQNYSCSCPSRAVCKHLLMAVLTAQNEPPGESEPEAAPPPDFSYIAATSADALEKLAGKRVFTAAVIAVGCGQESEVEEGSTLTVRLRDTGHVVRFLPSDGLEGAGCSCKSSDFCIHRTQAVLHVMLRDGGSLDPSFALDTAEAEPVFSDAPAPLVRDFVCQTLEIGLARLPDDMPGRFLQLATICHGARLPRLERLCNRVAGQLGLLSAKNAAFEREATLGDLSDIYSLCLAIEAGARDKETLGVFREKYQRQASLTLHGLGAYQWHSTGGYTGVTLFFYEPQGAQTLRYTLALPDSANPAPERMLDSSAPWGIPGNLRAICHVSLALTSGKLNGYGQLSSSDEGRARVLGSVDYTSLEFAPILFQKFAGLASALWDARERGQQEMVAILHPSTWSQSRFDQIDQIWSCIIYDQDGCPLTLQVRYEPSTKKLIENLAKYLPKERENGVGLLARIWMDKGRLVAFPVTLYAESIIELGFERERAKRGKKDYYDWSV